MSCFCSGIELNNSDHESYPCCYENNHNINKCVRIGYERLMSCAALPKANPPAWKALWTKMKREKRRLFFDCSSASHVVPYDPQSYSQNFDQGSMADPDNLSRSFSARFAVPSRVFHESASPGVVA